MSWTLDDKGGSLWIAFKFFNFEWNSCTKLKSEKKCEVQFNKKLVDWLYLTSPKRLFKAWTMVFWTKASVTSALDFLLPISLQIMNLTNFFSIFNFRIQAILTVRLRYDSNHSFFIIFPSKTYIFCFHKAKIENW